jgi:hypothetical protein
MESRKKFASCHFFLIPSNGAALRAKKKRARLHERTRCARLPHPDAAKAGCFASPGCGCALTLAQIFARTVCTRTGPRVIMHVGAARTCYGKRSLYGKPFLRGPREKRRQVVIVPPDLAQNLAHLLAIADAGERVHARALRLRLAD